MDVEGSFAIPSSWTWTSMDECFVVAGGIQKTPAREPRSNAFHYLGVGNVYRNRLDLATVKKFELAEGELDRFRLEPNDLLIVEGNGSQTEIGRCAVWQGEIQNCVHQNHIIRCRPISAAIVPFVQMYLNSSKGVAEMQRRAVTSSGLYSLSVGKIRTIAFPLPPMEEQGRILHRINSLIGLCEELQDQLRTSQEVATRFLDATIQKALGTDLTHVILTEATA
jgi:type I restriction enzyme, S subunit